MNIIYEADSRRLMEKADKQIQRAVGHAVQLTANKTGFRTATEIWRGCALIVTLGHDLRTATIHICPPDMAILLRRSNWRNGSAYYRNGDFWGSVTNTKAELI